MATKTKPAAKKLAPGAKKSTEEAKPKQAEPEVTSGPLSASDMAAAVGTDPRTLRKFLRASSHYEACGQGKRYTFAKKDIAPMKKRFAEWRATTERKAAEKKAEREAKTAAAEGQELDVEVIDDELDLEEADA